MYCLCYLFCGCCRLFLLLCFDRYLFVIVVFVIVSISLFCFIFCVLFCNSSLFLSYLSSVVHISCCILALFLFACFYFTYCVAYLLIVFFVLFCLLFVNCWSYSCPGPIMTMCCIHRCAYVRCVLIFGCLFCLPHCCHLVVLYILHLAVAVVLFIVDSFSCCYSICSVDCRLLVFSFLYCCLYVGYLVLLVYVSYVLYCYVL